MASADHQEQLVQALASELASVMGALLACEAGAHASLARCEPAWLVLASVEGAATGSIGMAMSRADAGRLARLVMGFDDTPDDASVTDMLQEVAGQALGALSVKPVASGLRFVTRPAVPASPALVPDDASVFEIRTSADFSPMVGCWAELAHDTREAAAGIPPPAMTERAAAHDPVVPSTPLPANLDVILDIDLPLSVRFGETEMSLDSLTRLGPGSVIDLGRSPDDPVDVLVNGRLVARGEVVVVSGNYGVRILEVVSAGDRIRMMGGA